MVRKKDSTRLVWDTKPRHAINSKDIVFQIAEVVLSNPARDESTIQSIFNIPSNTQLKRNRMNRLILGKQPFYNASTSCFRL